MGSVSPVPEHYLGKPVVSLVFVHIGDVEEGAALGRRLRHAAPPLGDAFLGRGAASAGGGPPVTGSLQTRGGAIARIGEQDTAAGHRAAGFEFMAAASWTDPGDDTQRTSTRLYADQIAPYGRGVYVNNLGIEGEDRPAH